ncbi:MAG: hypothetical protein PVG65_07310 [Candidatus Thorarchaeota archaeon]|jgi:hypothetical protein
MENIEKKENYRQVCIWPACIVGKDKISDFEKHMGEKLNVRVQYLEEIKTNPDVNENGDPIEGTGGRNDLFFAVHDNDISQFIIPKLTMGISWIEDVLANCNYDQKIYPERIFKYKCWDADDD